MVQADQLDQVHDLGLGPVQDQSPLAPTQAVRQHRQVDHQGRVSEHEATQIHEDVTLSAKGEYERPSTKALRTPILVSGAKQHRRVGGELDDGAKTYKSDRR
jgi:hypothetical protein